MHSMVRIGFFSGDRERLLEDMQALRPTCLASVPPLLNHIYDKIAVSTIGAKGLKGMLCRMAHRSKVKRITSGRGYRHPIWDRIVFDKVAKLFGGQIQLLVSGTVMLTPEVQNFMRACLSCVVSQGYGQTESSALCQGQELDDYSTGNSGPPGPGIDFRLRSIPELGYHVTDHPCPRGELLIRGENLAVGYYKDPEKTATLMKDGWLTTGDVARINADGTVTILERIDNVIKSGSLVHIELGQLEHIYSNHKVVRQCFVYSSPLFCKMAAIVVPKPEAFVPWARGIAKSPKAELEELCQNNDVAKALTQELCKLGSAAKVHDDAMISAIHLEPTPFAQINSNFYTTTFKMRRHLVNQHYKPIFDKLCDSDDFTADPKFKQTKK
ncbi:medium-chain fatty acid-CoA ligase faa2 [Coemansia sp. RSA 2599]|nr:medium-chain fatty acid-CoA ligase faa2 [Coemansia sp. RSA 2599]